ncbi:uncharacterized protein DUF1345 [Leucobacter luti]|uniref:Uncharacterized protein DUF1345 n=2 Tax=Leucobacter luti TaxID=340320 RepID=A0A4V6PVN9_9MICO|nr:uncharacterized protein DUF1345 [Leucobacter luti]
MLSSRYGWLMSARGSREIPLRFDDGFRAGIALLLTCPVPVAFAIPVLLSDHFGQAELRLLFALMCAMFSGFFLVYLLWSHHLFVRTDHGELVEIAGTQQLRGPSRLSRMLGVARTNDWVILSAASALIVSISAVVIGGDGGGIWLAFLVLVTTACAWATLVYAYAFRYFRLHASGDHIEFEIDDEPRFIDFVSMAVMVSSVGALSAGSPRTRAGLGAVRSHTVVAFAFNALVVAMIVSLVGGFITAP